jgi:hypothetical protein
VLSKHGVFVSLSAQFVEIYDEKVSESERACDFILCAVFLFLFLLYSPYPVLISRILAVSAVVLLSIFTSIIFTAAYCTLLSLTIYYLSLFCSALFYSALLYSSLL